MILLLVVELVVFSILSAPNKSVAEVFAGKSIFLKPKNLINIINALPISVFLTTGITLLMISGRLDLSTGANGTLCSMIVAFLLREGVPLIPSLLGAMFAGALIGFINAAPRQRTAGGSVYRYARHKLHRDGLYLLHRQ